MSTWEKNGLKKTLFQQEKLKMEHDFCKTASERAETVPQPYHRFPHFSQAQRNTSSTRFTVLSIFNTMFLQQLLLSQNFNPTV